MGRQFVAAFDGVVAIVICSLLGCAAPIVPAPNVVADREVRGCRNKIESGVGPLDVAIALDISQSTGRPTGFDIDQNGIVRPFQGISELDRGDSRLAAMVAGIRRLFRNAKGRDIRFSLVTFAGPSTEKTVGRTQTVGSIRDSRLRVPLTTNRARLDGALTNVLERGSEGRTLFAAGMRRATRSLISSPREPRRKIVLFLSDSWRPNGLDSGGSIEDVDPRMASAAIIAQRNNVVIHTFGLSPKAKLWRRQALGQIAGATGGTYHPIDDPGELYCHLVSALVPPIRITDDGWREAFARYRTQEASTSNKTDRSTDPSAGE